jgi:hypothetical protein
MAWPKRFLLMSKNEGARLYTIIIFLKSSVSCEALDVMESF